MQETAARPAAGPASRAPTRLARSGLGWLFLGCLGVLAALRLILSFVDNPPLFIEQVINGLQLGFMYALIALGYTMVYGIVKLINFAHGDVFMVGAFVSYYAVTRYTVNQLPAKWFGNLPPALSSLLGTLLVILVSMAVCAALAATIERVAYKPLRNAPRIAALITAIGVSFFLEYYGALPFVFSSNYIIYQRPFEITSWKIGGVRISSMTLIIIAVALLVLLLLQWIVRHTKMGKAMRATSFDKPTARLMGINIDAVITFTFVLGASLAAIASVLYAIAYPQLIVFMGIMPGLKAFVAAVLGGIGSIPGAFVGGLIMGEAEALSAHTLSTTLRDAIAFAILILVLLIRPQGLFGEPEGEKV
jgi:branched-chain amino acid transport system permease protein